MVMNPLISQKTGKPLVSNVRRKVIEKSYDWGLYVYKKSDGRWFTDGEGNVLNIESMRGDISKISELKNAAKEGLILPPSNPIQLPISMGGSLLVRKPLNWQKRPKQTVSQCKTGLWVVVPLGIHNHSQSLCWTNARINLICGLGNCQPVQTSY